MLDLNELMLFLIDIVQSIKSGTRKKKISKSVQPIRRVIENRNVPLPSNLPSFLSLPENKEDLAFFLATELTRQAPEGKVVVTGGGVYFRGPGRQQ